VANLLRTISIQFRQGLDELEIIIAAQLALPKSFQKDLLIEASFLKLNVLWENFIEQYFLFCMCSAQTYSGKILKPRIPVFPNEDDAFRELNRRRRERHEWYLDWNDPDSLEERVTRFFHGNSRLHSIYFDRIRINNTRILRNHIAHNSQKTMREFTTFVISELGYLPSPDMNVTDFLILNEAASATTYANVYINHYKTLENSLTR
jgi:hypothetical protein